MEQASYSQLWTPNAPLSANPLTYSVFVLLTPLPNFFYFYLDSSGPLHPTFIETRSGEALKRGGCPHWNGMQLSLLDRSQLSSLERGQLPSLERGDCLYWNGVSCPLWNGVSCRLWNGVTVLTGAVSYVLSGAGSAVLTGAG